MSANAVHGIWPPPERAVVSYTAAFVGISIGVIVWQLRPDTRTGILLTAWPFVSLLSEMKIVFAGSALAVDRLCDELACRADLGAPRPLVSERAAPLPARPTAIALAYGLAAAYGLVAILLVDPGRRISRRSRGSSTMRRRSAHLHGSVAAGLTDAFDRSLLPLAVLFVALLARKLVRDPGGRRVVFPWPSRRDSWPSSTSSSSRSSAGR
jgi:hypothetical protein